MEEFGFKVVNAAKTVFSYELGSKRILVATVVDDSVVAYSNVELYNKYREFLLRNLPITECPLDTICGMRITPNADSSILINQQEYIEKKADAFHQNGTKGSWIMSPMSAQFKLDDLRPETPDSNRVSYAQELMGSLIYATLTRPECKYACSKLSSVVTNPTVKEVKAMERVLKYLYNSRTTKLTFRAGTWVGPNCAVHDVLEPAAYVDASFAQETGRRSQTGFAFILTGAAIYCKSGKQTQKTDSTGYAETVALHEASN